MTKAIKKNLGKTLNIPEAKLPIKPLTKDELAKVVKNRISRITNEFAKGFKFLEGRDKSVTFFGSTRFKPGNPHYKQARELAQELARLDFTVVTGGGSGIMEAGNRGAFEKDGESLGLNIKLPHEQAANPYLTDGMEFRYFFSRKVLLSYAAEAYVYFPGGFGTLDELFEILTLVQTKKIEPVPVILMGSDYWNHVHKFIEHELWEHHKTIDKADMKIYTITDDIDEALEIIKKAPPRYQK